VLVNDLCEHPNSGRLRESLHEVMNTSHINEGVACF
jgi:hypothetical protein